MEKTTYEERLYSLTKQFTTQDIQRLLDAEIDAAGLLAMPALAGMVCLGHVLYGFQLTNRNAFLKFARYRMKINMGLAEILYDNVYHGLREMWASRSYIILCNSETDPLWSPRETAGIEVNALKLARLYVKVVVNLPEYSKTAHHKSDRPFDAYHKQIAEFRSNQGE